MWLSVTPKTERRVEDMFNARTTSKSGSDGFLVRLKLSVQQSISTFVGVSTDLEAMFNFDAGIGNQEEVGHAIEDALEGFGRVVFSVSHFDAGLDEILRDLLRVSSDEDYLLRGQYLGNVLIQTRAQSTRGREDGDFLAAWR